MFKVIWTVPIPTEEGYDKEEHYVYFKFEKDANNFKRRLVRAYKTLWFTHENTYVRINKVEVY